MGKIGGVTRIFGGHHFARGQMASHVAVVLFHHPDEGSTGAVVEELLCERSAETGEGICPGAEVCRHAVDNRTVEVKDERVDVV